jgi:hypothetical protein
MHMTDDPSHRDGALNFSCYSDLELEEAEISINAGSYPRNFQALKAEISLRKEKGKWQPELMVTRPIEILPSPGQCKIIIKGRYNSLVILFLIFWLTMWCLSEINMVSSLITGTPIHSKSGAIYSWQEQVFLTIFWTLGGAGAFCGLLWAALAEETLLLTEQSLLIYYQVSRFRFLKKEAPLSRINAVKKILVWRNRRGRTWQEPALEIQVQSGIKHVFAGNIGAEEADKLIALIKNHGKARGFEYF